MFDQHAVVVAHGVLGSLAWVIFFPLGSILIRVLNGPTTWKIHTAIQVFSMALFTACVGTGIQMAKRFHKLNEYHVIIGLLIFALMFIQAIAGAVHHIAYKTQQKRTIVSYIHIWLGRTLISIAMINGGFGLLLNPYTTRSQAIAYGVIAGVMWWTWLLTSAITESRRSYPDAMSSKERRHAARERRVHEREERARISRKKRLLGETGSWWI